MWDWMIDAGLIQGEKGYYGRTDIPGSEYNHAVVTAYNATEADSPERKKLIDYLWETGKFQGDQTKWYTSELEGEVANLGKAAESLGAMEFGKGSDLLLPGNAMLWQNSDTGEYWVVYEVPGITLSDGTTSDPIYTSWRVESDEDLEAIVGPDKTATPAWVGTNADFQAQGVIDLGNTTELRPFENIEGDPFDTWVEDMTILAEVKPWLLDEDYQALAVQAAMERADGRISLEELQTTKWYKEHTAAERAWMETAHGDPATAAQIQEDNRNSLKYRLTRAGISNVTDEIVNFIADKATMGSWSEAKLESQVAALSDPWSVDTIDDELFTYMATTGWTADTTQTEEDTVRGLLHTWLGPVWGNWDDQQVAERAGQLRNDPDGLINFTEWLKDQRMAMYPNHTDRELTYEAIAQPWRAYSANIWGAPVDDTDEVFQNVLRMNDPEEASKVLRKTGLDRGYDKTVNEVIGGVKSAMKTNVRGAV